MKDWRYFKCWKCKNLTVIMVEDFTLDTCECGSTLVEEITKKQHDKILQE